jgi:hypothetical protein
MGTDRRMEGNDLPVISQFYVGTLAIKKRYICWKKQYKIILKIAKP